MDFLAAHHAQLLTAPRCCIDDSSGDAVAALRSDDLVDVVVALCRDALKRQCSKRSCRSLLGTLQHLSLPS
eukprot:2901278-Alexandrium_andersonii.AAC.1